MATQEKKQSKLLLWIKRLGFWGFIFFLVKGLIWLAIGWWIAKK
jgi:hypothetical protein